MRQADKIISDTEKFICGGVQTFADHAHLQAVQNGWWHDLETDEKLDKDPLMLLMLIVSEAAEAADGIRKGQMSGKLPGFTAEEEEMADLFIRAGDYCTARGLCLGEAIAAKMAYNRTREDHKPENRRKEGGLKV